MEFWKMNGAGNDFIIINNIKEGLPHECFSALAGLLCERHLSIGADGLMVVEKPENGGDIKMLFYNSDGSAGEMCGNGARCICRYAYENGFAGETQKIETMAGTVTGERIDERNFRVHLNSPSLIIQDYRAEADGMSYDCCYAELGIPGLPHAAVYINDLKGTDILSLRNLGRLLRCSSAFPKGANINFYEKQSDGSVYVITYERGVEDLTYACGTGTGSVALALYLKGLLPSGELIAYMRGGSLKVNITEIDGKFELFLTGETNIVAQGRITDEEMNKLPMLKC